MIGADYSVADELLLAQLPAETRAAIERHIAELVSEAEERGFYAGAAAERKHPGDLMLPADCNQSLPGV